LIFADLLSLHLITFLRFFSLVFKALARISTPHFTVSCLTSCLAISYEYISALNSICTVLGVLSVPAKGHKAVELWWCLHSGTG